MTSSRQFLTRKFKAIFSLFLITFCAFFVAACLAILGGRDSSRCDLKCVQSLPFRKNEIILGMAPLPLTSRSPMEIRADLGTLLYQEHRVAEILVSGGMGSPTNDSEAHALRKMLELRGVPSSIITEEDQSRTTIENLKFCRKLFIKSHVESDPIYIVTHTYHAYRAGLIAKSLGLNAQVIGAEDANVGRFAFFAATRESLAVLYLWFVWRPKNLFMPNE